MKWGLRLLFLLALAACTKPYLFRTEDPEIKKMDDLPADFKLPAQIWELIEKNPSAEKAEKKEGEGKSEGKEGGSDSLGIFYAKMDVFLTEKNENILKRPSYKIELPRGGGTVDLASYLTEDQGSFFVGFELPEEFKEGKNLKIIYISQGRKRKIDGRVFGSGCNQYFDITKKFTEMMQTEGIRANTTRQRHVSLLAGHYIFSIIKDTQIFLTQVTITDSRYKNLLCESL